MPPKKQNKKQNKKNVPRPRNKTKGPRGRPKGRMVGGTTAAVSVPGVGATTAISFPRLFVEAVSKTKGSSVFKFCQAVCRLGSGASGAVGAGALIIGTNATDYALIGAGVLGNSSTAAPTQVETKWLSTSLANEVQGFNRYFYRRLKAIVVPQTGVVTSVRSYTIAYDLDPDDAALITFTDATILNCNGAVPFPCYSQVQVPIPVREVKEPLFAQRIAAGTGALPEADIRMRYHCALIAVQNFLNSSASLFTDSILVLEGEIVVSDYVGNRQAETGTYRVGSQPWLQYHACMDPNFAAQLKVRGVELDLFQGPPAGKFPPVPADFFQSFMGEPLRVSESPDDEKTTPTVRVLSAGPPSGRRA